MSDPGRVTLDHLFRNKVKVRLGEEELWMRTLSDLDLQARDEYSLLAMARRRRELEDPKTIEHELYIAGLQHASDDELRAIILISSTAEFQREAWNEVKPVFYPFPDDATDEEKAEVLKKREEDQKRMEQERLDYVNQRISSLQASLRNLTREQLLELAKRKQLEQQSRLAALRAFQDYTVYASVFRDEACQSRRFSSPEEVSQLPGDPSGERKGIRDQLIQAYFHKVDIVSHLDLQYFLSTDGSARPTSRPKNSSEGKRRERIPVKSPGGGPLPSSTGGM